MNYKNSIERYITDNSNLDKTRPYIGMSGIADCPLKIYRTFFTGIQIDYRAHLNSFRGYRMEKMAKEILIGSGIMKPDSEKHLIAPFDDRFQGHTDGESVNGELIEIKSKSKIKFDKCLDENKLQYREFMQVQCYMKYGNYSEAIVFIMCPETMDTHTIRITGSEVIQNVIEQKARIMLKAIDDKVAPACTCKKCRL